jgi:lysophospholipase L1-like esterase
MRDILQQVVALFQARGDANLHYISGLELFTKADMDAGLAPDQLHPNGSGYELMGARFAPLAFGPRGKLLPGRVQSKAML